MRLSNFLLAALATPLLAHPGEKHDEEVMKREIMVRDTVADLGKRSLDTCSTSLEARNLDRKNVQRRVETVRMLKKKKGLYGDPKSRRSLADLKKWEKVQHNMTTLSHKHDLESAISVYGGNTSAILTPTVTDGPYYVWGEMMRQNVKEKEYSDGVDVYLEIQYIDINNCRPVEGALVDIWQANATGVYSGISMDGNYASNGYNSTYLRGFQQTNHDGIVNFDTIFPGHYAGRAIHTHLLTHLNTTMNPKNKTMEINSGTRVAQIGQLFWPENLRSEIEALYPYNTNTQDIVSNDDDMWSIEQASAAYDPFPRYVYLGDKVRDGLFAWIQIGVNTTQDWTSDEYYNIAAYMGENGGYANANAMSMGGAPPS